MTREIPCSTCQATADWVVTVTESDEDKAGELKAMCSLCRRKDETVTASIPVELVDEDTLVGLYASGYVQTDPGIAVRLVFGESVPSIEDRARHALPPR